MLRKLFKINILKAFVIFFLPFTPYLHLLVPEGHEPMSVVWSEFVSGFSIAIDFETWLYFAINWFSIVILYFIWLNTSRPKWKISIVSLLLWSIFVWFQLLIDADGSIKWIIKILPLLLILLYGMVKLKNITFSFIELKHKVNSNFLPMILFLMPFAMLIPYIFPINVTSVDFGIITIDDGGFEDVVTFLLVIGYKIILFLSWVIWFWIEKKWWRYAILSPIIVVSNQLFNILFYPESTSLDEFELYQSGPYLLLLALFLILLVKLIDNQEKIKQVLEDKYNQMEQLIEQRLERRQKQIEENQKKIASNSLKTNELKKIREELEKELKSRN